MSQNKTIEHLDIAVGLLKQGDKYILQLRNGEKQAGKLDHVGCFGGQIEPGESPLEAACREIAEESTFKPNPALAIPRGEVRVLSERHNQPITVRAICFQFDVPASVKVQAKEGTVVIMSKAEIRQNSSKLTPALKACLELIKD